MDTSREDLADTEAAPASPGEILRRCREFSKLSLEEAAEATNISKTYLRALEENRFHDLPSPVYIKGFLKIYATYLGLQPDDLLEMVVDAPVRGADEKPETMPKKRSGQQWVQRLALPLILLGALIFSAVILQPVSQEIPHRPAPPPPQQPQPVPQQTLQPANSSSRAAAQPPSAPVAAEPPAARHDDESPLPPVKQPKSGFVVRMKVLKNGSLMVVIDDTASQNYQLTAGDLIEWKASTSLLMDLSDAGGVEFELNGKPVKHTVFPESLPI